MLAVGSARPTFRSLLLLVVLVRGEVGCRSDRSSASNTERARATPAPSSAATATGGGARERRADYVGSERCDGCHAQPYSAWKSSHHRLAMQIPSERSVLG